MPKALFCFCIFFSALSAKKVSAQQPDSLVQSSIIATDSLPLATSVTDSLPHSTSTAPFSLKAAPASNKELKTKFTREPIVSKPMSLKAVLIPTAMIAYGAFTVSNKGLQKVNLAVRDDIFLAGKTGVHRRLPLDDYTLIAPTIAVYGLNIAGVKGKNNFADRTIMYGMANLIGMGISSSVKKMTGVMRPDSSNRLSFPSGHTTKAFIAAEFMRQEYKGVSPWYGIGAYTMAVGTGVLRMYNNKHWLNDVIAGAGVGILSTRLSYWLYPKIKNSFLGRGKGQTMIMPTYENKTVGLGMVHTF